MMLRKMIFKTDKGEEVTLPVTPKSYSIRSGMSVQVIDVHELGPYPVPTYPTRDPIQLECFLPSSNRPYCVQYTDQAVLLAWFEKKVSDKEKMRFIVSGTAVNLPVRLTEIIYGEQDGSNDLYLTLTLHPYVALAAPQVLSATTSTGATRESTPQKSAATTYTVQAGDTLWGIARRFYGDGMLYAKLAAYNGIKNPNLIFAGQVLKIPDTATLGATAAPSTQAPAASRTATITITLSGLPRAYVNYGYTDKASGKNHSGQVNGTVHLTPSVGTKVCIRWVPQGGYGCDKLTLDGRSQAGGKGYCYMEAGKNQTLDLHFVRW